jgi:hypothetical protein
MQSNNEELQSTNEELTTVNDEMQPQGRAAAGKQRSDQFLEQRQYSDRDAGQRPVQRPIYAAMKEFTDFVLSGETLSDLEV